MTEGENTYRYRSIQLLNSRFLQYSILPTRGTNQGSKLDFFCTCFGTRDFDLGESSPP